MNDLVKSLRSTLTGHATDDEMWERVIREREQAADEIERLRAALEVLSDHYKSRYGDCTRGGVISAVEQIARAALKKESN